MPSHLVSVLSRLRHGTGVWLAALPTRVQVRVVVAVAVLAVGAAAVAGLAQSSSAASTRGADRAAGHRSVAPSPDRGYVPAALDGDPSSSGPGPVPAATPTEAAPTLATVPLTASALAADGIPATALDAYHRAATRANTLDPACGIDWTLIAAIGRVESDHGRFGGAVLFTNGTSSHKIIGIALNGTGTQLIPDTD